MCRYIPRACQQPVANLTVLQQRKTMMKPSRMPAVPTSQLSRKNMITPKMFCNDGRNTPSIVPKRARFTWGEVKR